jgi:hypothetical protein
MGTRAFRQHLNFENRDVALCPHFSSGPKSLHPKIQVADETKAEKNFAKQPFMLYKRHPLSICSKQRTKVPWWQVMRGRSNILFLTVFQKASALS